MYLGTNFLPPVIHPTQQIVNHTFSTTVVPHIHPVHTTTVNHHMYQHKHYCPQTASCAEECCNQHIDCCNTCAPAPIAPIAAPMPNALPNAVPNAPGFGGMGGPGFGGMGGPGFGPGAPGFGPGPGPYMGRRR
ncbi:spore coat protein D [Neobacillus bataviensis]|jgi:spore coat protein D|uniref:Spore coat protein D n=1 Tax=Neobacillus bataviensis TaxID=220685 RepID=A0A561DS02_9BACI|nr:CotD family spore coat protein [Neobacillus bataviensis]TWE06141.1 spore coat protein D [Neobacillus bataviensis]